MIVLTLVAITGVTALVVAAWKLGGASTTAKPPSDINGDTPRGAAPRCQAARRRRRQQRRGRRALLTGSGPPNDCSTAATLERRESQAFTGNDLWSSVSAPRHVVLSLDGAGWLYFHGLCPKIVTVTPHHLTQTVSCR